MKPYVIKQFMDMPTTSSLYYSLINQQNWGLNRCSKTGANDFTDTFPGMTIYDGQDPNNIMIENLYYYGYFSSMVNAIRIKYENETGGFIPPTIKRIHLGAKNNNSKTDFHPDSYNPTDVTLLAFIMPNWSPEWGGEIKIEDESYPCEPGSFIIFPSTMYHNGEGPVEKTPYWRISLNIICGNY